MLARRGDLLGKVALEALASRDGDEGPLLLIAPTVSPARPPSSCCARSTAASAKGSSSACCSPPARPGCEGRSTICARWSGGAMRSCWLGNVPDERLDTVTELVRAARRRAAELGRRVAREARRAARDRRRPERRSGGSGAATTPSQQADALRLDEPLEREVEALARAIAGDKPVLVVGERGSGRLSRLRAVGARLAPDGWMTFEAGAAEVNAGMSYVGELEGRVRYLVETLDDKPVLWIVPEFETLLGAGRLPRQPARAARPAAGGDGRPAPAHRRRDRSGRRTSGSCGRGRRCGTRSTSCAWSRWTSRGRSRSPIARRREPSARCCARRWRSAATSSATTRCPARCSRCWRRCAGAAGTTRPLELADVLATISERSGLPLSLLDDRERLDVDALRSFFSRRVIGQPEAVECVVERIALLKAGLADPTRPQAVLLFVGPTGTGKTEIAKSLAEYLFGSRRPDDPDRPVGVSEPRQRAPDARRRRRLRRRRVAGEPDPARAVLGRAARRVREGRPGRVGPVPAGVRRRAAERSPRRGRGLPPRRDHHDLEPGREDPDRIGHRVLARDRASRPAASRRP